MEEQRNKKPIIILVGALILAAVILVIVLAVSGVFNSPATPTTPSGKFIASVEGLIFKNDFSKQLSKQMDLLQKAGTTELEKLSSSGNFEISAEINPEIFPDEEALSIINKVKSANISFKLDADLKNYKAAMDLGIKLADSSLDGKMTIIDKDGIYMSFPQIYDKTVRFGFDTIKNMSSSSTGDLSNLIAGFSAQQKMSIEMLTFKEGDWNKLSSVVKQFFVKHITDDKIKASFIDSADGKSKIEELNYELTFEEFTTLTKDFIKEVLKNNDFKAVIKNKINSINSAAKSIPEGVFKESAKIYEIDAESFMTQYDSMIDRALNELESSEIPADMKNIKFIISVVPGEEVPAKFSVKVLSGDTEYGTFINENYITDGKKNNDLTISALINNSMAKIVELKCTEDQSGKGNLSFKTTVPGSDSLSSGNISFVYDYTRSSKDGGTNFEGSYTLDTVIQNSNVLAKGKINVFENVKELYTGIQKFDIDSDISVNGQNVGKFGLKINSDSKPEISAIDKPADSIEFDKISQSEGQSIVQKLVTTLGLDKLGLAS